MKIASNISNFKKNRSTPESQISAISIYLSPWPFFIPWSVYYLLYLIIKYFHGFYNCPVDMKINFFIVFLILIFLISNWVSDLIEETTFRDYYYLGMEKNYKLGFLLFIVSEVMLFFSFFWVYFHASIYPTIAIGCVWPPHIIFTDMGLLPILNTYMLISSGISLTWSHRAHAARLRSESIIGLIITIVWGIIFLKVQLFEYKHNVFCLNDGIFGSCFYTLTGFHGFHVFFGLILLLFAFFRLLSYHFSVSNHFQFLAAIWYWHFVDVVWLFLFVIIYTPSYL